MLDTILEAANKVAGVDIRDQDRTGKVVFARHSYYHIAKNINDSTFEAIGEHCRRHHSTVMNGCVKAEDMMDYAPFRKVYDAIIEELA